VTFEGVTSLTLDLQFTGLVAGAIAGRPKSDAVPRDLNPESHGFPFLT